MTQSIKCFRKAFPEYASYTDEEAIAFISSFKKEKRNIDRWINKRVNYYGNRLK